VERITKRWLNVPITTGASGAYHVEMA